MKVRSAIATILALVPIATAFAAVPAAAAAGSQSGNRGSGPPVAVTLAVLPAQTSPDDLAAVAPDLAVGVLSAGLGGVPPRQTYLDIGQGSRLSEQLYPEPLPPLPIETDGVPAADWAAVLSRAEGAPAELAPGLLAATLEAAGIEAGAAPGVGQPSLIAAGAAGRISRRQGCATGRCPGLTVLATDLAGLTQLADARRQGQTLIAIERPQPDVRLLSIAIAGDGYSGTLTSDSTRLAGYVLSTDIAPTVLARFGLAAPDEIGGRAIGADRAGDRTAISALKGRLGQVSDRRAPVVGTNLLIWIGLVALAVALGRRRGATLALPLLATAVAAIPLLLLVGAALQPSLLVERLLVGAGGPLLALALVGLGRRRLGPARACFAAFAITATASILTTAVDVLAGSPLTTLSLVGPSPGFGVRFFGIGNELEAAIGALLALGAGAAVTARAPADPRRAVALTAAIAAALAVAVFAPGRFGADVGAAITFPAAAAGVVLAALGVKRSRLVLVVVAPVLAVAVLIAVDLAIGGDAHLSRSVLDAGGLDQLGEVFERRIRLSASSFARFFDSPPYIAALVAIGAAIAGRGRLRAWFAPFPAAGAGFVGAITASAVGALANDSGAMLLLVGTALCAAFAGLAWSAQYFTSDSDSR